MLLVAVLCDSAISFVKKLIIIETAGGLLAAGFAAFLSVVSDGSTLGGLADLSHDPLFQKKAFILGGVVAAPLIALSWAIANQLKSD